MKKTIILILGLYLTYNLSAQEVDEKTNVKIDEAMLEYHYKDYTKSLQLFEEEFKNKETQTDNNLYNAACSAALCGEKVKAWKYLKLAILAGYTNYKHLFKDVDLILLHDDDEWKKMQIEKGFDLDKIRKAFEFLNTEVQLYELVPFERDKLYGYMQQGTKKIMVEPMFSKAGFFYEHWRWDSKTGKDKVDKRMEVELNGFEVWIRANGNLSTDFPSYVVPVVKEEMSNEEEEEITPNVNSDTLGFIEKNGIIVSYSNNYEDFEGINIDNEICAIVKYKEKYGIVNNLGIAIAPNFALRYSVFYKLELDDKAQTIVFFAQDANSGKWCILAKNGNIIIQGLDENPKIDDVFYIIRINKKWGAINLAGKMIIPPKYTENDFVFSKSIIDNVVKYYFHFKLNDDFFYVDENGIEYR